MIEDKLIYNGYLKIMERTIGNTKREIVHQEPAVAVGVLNKGGNKMLLVKQYRASICDYTWELPAGMMDVEGETPRECMVRELEEEANIWVNHRDLGYEGSYYPNIGVSDHEIHLFSVVVEELENNYKVNDTDVEEVRWFTFNEIQQMINNKQIVDGKTILLFYKLN